MSPVRRSNLFGHSRETADESCGVTGRNSGLKGPWIVDCRVTACHYGGVDEVLWCHLTSGWYSRGRSDLPQHLCTLGGTQSDLSFLVGTGSRGHGWSVERSWEVPSNLLYACRRRSKPLYWSWIERLRCVRGWEVLECLEEVVRAGPVRDQQATPVHLDDEGLVLEMTTTVGLSNLSTHIRIRSCGPSLPWGRDVTRLRSWWKMGVFGGSSHIDSMLVMSPSSTRWMGPIDKNWIDMMGYRPPSQSCNESTWWYDVSCCVGQLPLRWMTPICSEGWEFHSAAILTLPSISCQILWIVSERSWLIPKVVNVQRVLEERSLSFQMGWSRWFVPRMPRWMMDEWMDGWISGCNRNLHMHKSHNPIIGRRPGQRSTTVYVITVCNNNYHTPVAVWKRKTFWSLVGSEVGPYIQYIHTSILVASRMHPVHSLDHYS